MFLNKLTIFCGDEILREIQFRQGLNLIVDETPLSQISNETKSGNSIGKTTILRLIDFCFGGDAKEIYKDKEFTNQTNREVEDFLKDKTENVTIELQLIESFTEENSKIVVIKRNFLERNNKLFTINGEDCRGGNKNVNFQQKLKKILFDTEVEKPTLRQIIAKNIRIDSNRIENIVKVLGGTPKNVEYEALYFFWLGVNTDKASQKQHLDSEKRKEDAHRKRLIKSGTLEAIQQSLQIIGSQILELEEKQKNFDFSSDYQNDIDLLNNTKKEISQKSNELTQLVIRKELILESKEDLEKEFSTINIEQVQNLYKSAQVYIDDLQSSFEQTLNFHNKLIKQNLDYIIAEIPDIEREVNVLNNDIKQLLAQEKSLTEKLQKLGLLEDLEKIILNLKKLCEQRGERQNLQSLWQESNEKVKGITKELSLINADNKNKIIQERVSRFNQFFPRVSQRLYKGKLFIKCIRR